MTPLMTMLSICCPDLWKCLNDFHGSLRRALDLETNIYVGHIHWQSIPDC